MSVDDVKAVVRRASDYVNEINRKDRRIAELEAERDEAFNAGLEAAAQVADKQYNDSSWNGACMEIAIGIRALKDS